MMPTHDFLETDTQRRSIYSDDTKWVDGINALFLILGTDCSHSFMARVCGTVVIVFP